MLAHVPTVTAAASGGVDLLTIAATILIGGLGALVLTTILADRRGLLPDAEVPFRRWIAIVLGGLSVGAASIHFAVIGAHFAEYPPFGVAFVALAWFQTGWAVAYLLAPGRQVALAAIVVNAGALIVWAASRTVGLPIGPEPGQTEPVGPLDIAAGVMEIALIVALAWDLGAIGNRVRPALSRAGAAVVLGSMALLVVLLTTTAFVAAGGDPHGGLDHDPEPPIGAAPIQPLTSSPSPPSSQPGTSQPSGMAIIDPPIPTPPSGSPAAPPTTQPSTEAPSSDAPAPTPSPSRVPTATPARVTPAPPTPKPPTPEPPPATSPGQITFGTSVDQDGRIATPIDRVHEGQSVVWVAAFTEAPNASTVRFLLVQILPDGREFEHWREDVPLADPAARRVAGSATMSIYLHSGAGSYRMRYMRGDALLAEGAFEFVP